MDLLKLDGFQKIYAVDTFNAEYEALYKNSSDYEAYYEKFKFNLGILDNAKNLQVALKHKNIEQLSNTGLYCIRHVSNKNPRTIFFYALEDNIYILLHTFFEKESKKDYKRAVKSANAILKKLLTSGEEEIL